METTVQLYLATKAVALRTGFISQRYVTRDGRYIVNDRDLRNAHLTEAERAEHLTPITKEQSRRLQAENKYKMGLPADK